MSVSSTLTFQQVPPFRPAEADIVNGTKVNATPTVPPDMAAAEEYMQMTRLLVAYGKMLPMLRVSVDNTTGTPTVHSWVCVREDVTVSDISLTDNGVGDVSVTFTASKLPATNTKPMATANELISATIINATYVANGARVIAYDITGTPIDVSFTVEIFGA